VPISARTPTSGTAALSAAFTLTLPTGVAAGDFLVLVVTNAWTTSGPAAPTGWTRNYAASAGTAQFCGVYTARYSAGLTLNFTNVGAIAAWVCGAYFQAGFSIALDTAVVAATSTANNATMSTGAPSTAQAGDYEVLAYGWGSNATITAAANMTIDRQQVNSTTCAAALGHNNTNPLGHPVTATAFAPTLSATNRAKTGVGILLRAYTTDLTVAAAGKAATAVSGAGGGPIALVASLAESPGTSHGFTTSALNTTGANLFVIGVGGINGPWTLTDSQGNSYAPAEYVDGSGFGNPRGNAIYYATGTGGPGHTFTIAGTSNFTALCVAAYSGAAASPLGSPSSHVANGSASTSVPGSITPAVPNALVITTQGGQDGQATASTISAGFSTPLAVPNGGGRQMSYLAYQVQGAAAAANPTWTLPSSVANWSTIAYFRPAPSSGGLGAYRPLSGTALGAATASGSIVAAGPPPPGYALVASVSGQDNDTFSTVAIDTTGATLLVVCWCQANAKPTLSDNYGNTYVLARENDGGDRNAAISYVALPTVGPGHILTLTGTDIFASAQFYAFRGAASAPLDQTGQAFDYTDPMSGPTLTPTEDGELLVVIDQFDNSATIGTWGPSGWAAALGFAGTGGSILGSCSSYLIQTTAAAATPIHTLGAPQGRFVAMATFKAATGAPVGGYRNLTASATGAATSSATATARRALSAASTGAASPTATPTRYRRLAASVTSNGLATTTATATRRRPLSTSIQGVGSANATVTRRRAMAAVTSSGTSSTAATVRRIRPLAATAQGASSTTATLYTTNPTIPAVSSLGQATAAATPTRRRSAGSGSSAGVATVGGQVGKVSPQLQNGTSAGQATTVATASRKRTAGLVTSAGTATTTALPGRIRSLAAFSAGTATTAALPGRVRTLASISSAGTAIATARLNGPLRGASIGTATVNGFVFKVSPQIPSVTSAGKATATGLLGAVRRLAPSSATGTASVSVSLSRRRPLLGSSAGRASTTASATRIRPLAATAPGRATTIATATRRRPLLATATGQATTTAGLAGGALGITAAGRATTTATLSVKRRLLATAAAAAATTATPTRKRALGVRTATGQATTAGTPTKIRATLTAASAGQATTLAPVLSRRRSLQTATAAGRASTTAEIIAGISRALFASASSQTTVTGKPTRIRWLQLTTIVIGTSSTTATVKARRALRGTSAGRASAVGLLEVRIGQVVVLWDTVGAQFVFPPRPGLAEVTWGVVDDQFVLGEVSR
jgi:hypothetical protein